MAASFDTFRLPCSTNQQPQFIFYSGPPVLKPSRRRTRKDASATTDEWTNIDEILEHKPGSNAESVNGGILTPTMKRAKSMGLVYSGGEIDNEQHFCIQDEEESYQSGHDHIFGSPSVERISEIRDHRLFNGGCQDNPLIIDDRPAYTDRENDLPSWEEPTPGKTGYVDNFDADRCGAHTAKRTRGLGCIADGPAHISDGQSLPRATVMVEDVTVRKGSYNEDSNIGDPQVLTQERWKSTQTGDEQGFDNQMSDTSLGQSLEDLQPAERQQPFGPSHNALSSSCSFPSNRACAMPHCESNRPLDDADGNNASNHNGNKDNENIGQIIDNNNSVRTEEGDDTGGNDHGECIHSNDLLQSTRPSAPSSCQVPSSWRNNTQPHEIGTFGGEDGSDEADERDSIHPPPAMLIQGPKYTDILAPEHQDPVNHAGHSDSDSDVVSSYSDGEDTNYEDSDFNENVKEDEVDEGDKENNRTPRLAERSWLSTRICNGAARQCLDKRTLQKFQVSSSPTSSIDQSDRRNVVTPGSHYKQLLPPACGRRRARSVSSRDSLSGSDAAALSASSPECGEWPIQGSIKRRKVGAKEFYTLYFSSEDHCCQIPSSVSFDKSRRTATKSMDLGMATDPPCTAGHAVVPRLTRRRQRTRPKFTQEENKRLINMKEKKNLSWAQIKKSFPRRSIGSLQVHYCTKLKGRATI